VFSRISALVSTVSLATLIVAGPAAAETSALTWTPCGNQNGECATVPVPVDWNNPGSGQLGITIGRLKATDPAHRIGVLFAAPGGPGASGIDRYLGNRESLAAGELRKPFDIVTWDQRGVGRSSQIKCSAALLDRFPGSYPAGEKEYRDLLAYNAELGADCRARSGPVFDHADTLSAVRDLDAIRAALGEDRISFYGASYGTQVGQQYAELFPTRLRAMTIDSNMDHSTTSAARYLATATADLEGSFNAFADWCARTANCPLYGQDVRVTWDRLHAKAEAGTLTDPGTGQAISGYDLRNELFRAMYQPSKTWYPFATRLRTLDSDHGTAAPSRMAAADDAVGYSWQAIWCSDWKWQISGFAELRAYRELAAAIAPHTKLIPYWSDITSCLGWPAKVNNPQHRLSITGAPKILIVKSTYDIATPSAWNFAVASQIRNSVLLTYDGIGHGQYYQGSTCTKSAIERYLTDLVTPAPGTHCPAVYPTTPQAATHTAEIRRPVHAVG